MKKVSLILMTMVLLLSIMTSCRPPELESVYVDFKAERYDDALKNAKIAAEKYPANSEALYMLGSTQGRVSSYKEMTEAFDKSLAIDNKFAESIEQERAYYFQTLFNAGVNKYNSFRKQTDRESEEAIEILNKAIADFNNANVLKNDYMSVSLSALCNSLLGKNENALKDYKALTVMKPDTTDSWIALGQFYYLNQKYQDAAQVLEKAIEIDPETSEAISMLAQIYDVLGEKKKAITFYEKAIEIAPEEKTFPFNLGLLYFNMANKEGASEDDKKDYLQKCADNFGIVIEMDPESKDAYDIGGNALILLGKYEEAVLVLKQGIDFFPDNYSFWFNVGVAYAKLQDKEKAVKAFAKAEELQEEE